MRLLLWPFFLFFLLTNEPARELTRFQYQAEKMGTTFRIIFYATDSLTAKKAISACWNKIDALDKIFSDYREDSELTQLSHSSGKDQWVKVSDDLWQVLNLAHHFSIISDGAFDITVGPVSKLWRRAFRRREMPNIEELFDAKQSVSYHNIKFDSITHQVLLIQSDMKLDVGGIAKGYTVDEVFKVLLSFNIEKALIDGGGDIYAGEPPPDSNGWNIQIHSSKKYIILVNQAIASSGDTFQYLEWEGKRYAHIVNPLTGLGIINMENTNIKAENCATADALATIISVLGKDGCGLTAIPYTFDCLN